MNEDLEHLHSLSIKLLKNRNALLVGGLAALLSVRLLRGLVAPPLAWDALTYHLLKAGRWVQSGSWTVERAPDAWSYYEYFPPGGDLLWAWTMLPIHSDLLLALAGLAVLLTCALGAYTAATLIAPSRHQALETALMVCTVPCVINFLTSAYVNTTMLALVLLSLTFLGRAVVSRRWQDAILASAALALGAGIQFAFLPILFVGAGVLVAVLSRRSSARLVAATRCALVAVVGLPGYALAWWQQGSPLYPLSLSLGDWILLPGNENFSLLHSGEILAEQTAPFQWSQFLKMMFLGHLNLGLGSLVILILGIAGMVHLFRERRYRAYTGLLAAVAAVVLLSALSGAVAAEWTRWVGVAGRFLMPTVAALALLGAALPDSSASLARFFVVVLGLEAGMPRGFVSADWDAMIQAMWFLLPLLAASITLVVAGRVLKRSLVGIAFGVSVIAVGLTVGLGPIRAEARYEIYSAFDKGCYDLHPIEYGDAWPIWKALDRTEGLRIAFAAGWDGTGHNWYRYPLLGSRLQNEVVYVPVTRDGSIIDYRTDELERQASAADWLKRLFALQVDVFVVTRPSSVEHQWLDEMPELFTPVARSHYPESAAYKINIASLEERLQARH